ncbi:MAG: hypothetical protein R2771_02955 [Saprospiraceae bacterium]
MEVFQDFVGYSEIEDEFVPSTTINSVLAKYNEINGDVDGNYNRLWDDMYLNVGQVLNRYSKSEEDRYSF